MSGPAATFCADVLVSLTLRHCGCHHSFWASRLVRSQDPFRFRCNMNPATPLMVTCIWHDGLVEIGDAYQNGKKWKCRPCYSTERWLQKRYTQENRRHVWTNMSHEERAKEIAKNIGSHGSQGQKRSFRVVVFWLELVATSHFVNLLNLNLFNSFFNTDVVTLRKAPK